MPNGKKATPKKITNKEPAKTGRKRRKINAKAKPKNLNTVDHDEVLRLINHVQVNRKKATFRVLEEEASVICNILSDAGVVFNKTEGKEICKFEVEPGIQEEEGKHALSTLEELNDEMIEEGQIFE